MESAPGPSTSTGKRKKISLQQKRAILDEVRMNVKKADIAINYGIAQSTLSTIIKNGDKIEATLANDVGGGNRKRIRSAAYPDVEDALYKWFVDARAKRIPLSGPIMLTQARNIGFCLGYGDFQPQNGWLQRFKDRHDIKCKNIVGEAASVDEESVEKWMAEHAERVLSSYEERDIYNADETGLFFQMLPSKTLAAKADKCVGGKDSKNRVTVLLCCNMDGSDKRDAFVIGKSRSPRGFKDILSLPVRYRDQSKAWMTRALFREWLTEFDKEMVEKRRKILLLLDNCTAHHVNAHLSNIEVLFLPPNTTAKLQPLDQGIIANFKIHYRRRVIERLLIDMRTATNPRSLKIPLSRAVIFLSGAWRDVKHRTISHCFEKGGFVRQRGGAGEALGDGAAGEVIVPDSDGAMAEVGMEQLWAYASEANLVPPGVDHMEFVCADDDLVTTEDLSMDDIVRDVMNRGAGKVSVDETASAGEDDSNDDSAAPPPVSSAAAIAALDTVRTYLAGNRLDRNFDSHLDGIEAAIIKHTLGQRVQGSLEHFLVPQ